MYLIWSGIKTRCNNPRHHNYPDYGARGIKMCPQWEADFLAFLRDVGERPSKSHSLERQDNSRGYWPDNVRWATAKEQALNTRRNRLLTHNGRTMPLCLWAREFAVDELTLHKRLKRGWPMERALQAPKRGGDAACGGALLAHRGRSMTIVRWAEETGLTRSTIRGRLAMGWSVERALETPRLR